MMKGQQKGVLTPGKNQKRYIAGAICARTKRKTWVTGERKTSALFIAMLRRLVGRYRRYRVIHVIGDNYIIHKSRITARAVAAFGGKVPQDVSRFAVLAQVEPPASCPRIARVFPWAQALQSDASRCRRMP